MLKLILKIFLILILIAVGASAVFWLIYIKEYPWWVVLTLILGLFGLFFGYIYIKKYFLRRREKDFISRVIAKDEEAIKAAPEAERLPLKELQEKWKESIDLVRHSYLRKKGNPLYVLPWYLIIGETGAGKTSAIKNTNLSSPISEVSRTAGISVTRNCDWWFFEEAIILDTAGRYTIPVDEKKDKEEWKEFLTLLAKYRRREPINGVIVTIAADKLLELDEARLSDEGHSVRQRIDHLMRILGAKFPIYVLVTKLDLVQGMVEFSNLLPKKAMDQAMGYINNDLKTDWEAVLDESMTGISNNLKELQLILMHQETTPEPEVFRFINGFERLRFGLDFFVQAVFDENPYQETPLMRGLFFSSAIQEGTRSPESSGLFGLNKEEIQDIVHNNGLFLKDLFKSILPKDRNLFSPIKEFLSWRRLTRSLGFLSWLLLWVCLCGFMGFSYYNNMNALEVIDQDSYKPPELMPSISENLIMLDQLRSKILEVERINNRWFIPHLGFQKGLILEANLKDGYLQLYKDGLLNPFDSELLNTIQGSSKNISEEVLLNYFEYVIARITIIYETLRNDQPSSLGKFQTISNDFLLEKDKELTPEVASIFATAYHDYLNWQVNEKEFEDQLEKYNTVLRSLLENTENLKVIIRNRVTDVSEIHLGDFWGNMDTGELDENIYVANIFTSAGKKQIDDFFNTIEAVVEDTTVIQEYKNEYWKWYQMQFYDAWSRFSRNFSLSINIQEDVNIWQQTAISMASDDNPYMRILELMAEEFAQINVINKEPPWVILVRELNEVRKQAKTEKEKEEKSIIGEIASRKDQLVQKTLGAVDKQKARELELRQKAAVVYVEYEEALKAIAPALTTRNACFQMISEYSTASKNTAQSSSLLTNSEIKFNKLKNYFIDKGDIPFVWDLVYGPHQFAFIYGVKEAACVIQEQWEEQVLGGIKGVDEEQIPQLLFDTNEGLVWKFTNTTCKPFIYRNINGYWVRIMFENLLPFNKSFINFLNTGTESIVTYKPDYPVTMETLPIEVNEEAKIKPYGCILRLQSTEGTPELRNYNYPMSTTFHWSPDNFGDVTLFILIGELMLKKNYEGSLGFAKFLSDFRDGSRIFKAEEFTKEEKNLNENGITWLKISYKITGGNPVIQLLRKPPLQIPMEIVSCWDVSR